MTEVEPPSWTLTTLGELCAKSGGSVQTGPFGSQLHASDYVIEGIPSVMPQNIGDNVISELEIARIRESDALRLAKYRLRTGDIVYSRRGDVEKRALVRDHQGGWLCGTGCLRVRFGDGATDAAFISYLLGTEDARAWIVRHAVGATMPNLNTSILSSVPLRIPVLSTQRAIGEVLGALDDKIAANCQLASRAHVLADTHFLNARRQADLKPSIFGALADIRGGGTPSTAIQAYWNGGIPWVTPTDVTNLPGPYLESTSRTITEAGLKACSSDLHPVGSIIMTSRATIGAFAIAEVPSAVNQGFIVVRVDDPALKWWLYHDMQSRVDEFKSYANGATFLELSRGKFKTMAASTPTGSQLSAFGATVGSLHLSARQALVENRSLAALRDTLLPQLMSGKLRVKDAEKQLEDVV